MKKIMLSLGVAAMALATPALAGPHGGGGGGGGGNLHGGGGGNGDGGNPHGGGKGGGGGGNPHSGGNAGGGGGGHARGGGVAMGGSGHGGHGGGFRVAQGGSHGGGNHGGGQRIASHGGARHTGGQRVASHGGNRHAERVAQRTQRSGRVAQRAQRSEQIARQAVPQRNFIRDNGGRIAGAAAGVGAVGVLSGGWAGARYADYRGQRAVIDGCPPGLADKNNGCLPPGQVKKQWGYGQPLYPQYADSYLPIDYRGWYPDSDQYYYRYGDGYAYRVGRSDNLIDGLFPLNQDDYYYPGDYYPAAYDVYNVPIQYQSYYPDNGGDYAYRYGGDAIYSVNRGNGLIDSITALLSPALGVGQALPDGYDVYNVPDAYRDRYYDTPDTDYRYANGNIYQVDAKTQIIQAIVSALT